MNINDEQAVINQFIDDELAAFTANCKDVKSTEAKLRELFSKLKELEKEYDAAQTHNNL